MPRLWTGDLDAFGIALRDRLAGLDAAELIERDDGYIAISSSDLQGYFGGYEEWPETHQWAAAQCRGRVLDVGCGPGRFVLHLQERGHDVMGLDISEGAVEVCRARGAHHVRNIPITAVGPELGTFDTILMMGNNGGLLASRSRARSLLRRFRRITSPRARILLETLDPYRTDDPLHLAYHRRNARRRRMPGQIRIRVRYKTYRTPWFDYLFVSSAELLELLEGSGWQLVELRESGGPTYVVMLESA